MKIDHRLKRRIRHLHKKHRLHHRTIFYMRKGRKLHFHSRIISESVKILIIASVVSTIGGIGLQSIEGKLVTIIPLLILLPALNDMIGDFGTTFSSRFTTDLYLGKVNRKWWKSVAVRHLMRSHMIIAFLTAFYLSFLTAAVALYKGYGLTAAMFFKIGLISVVVTMALIGMIFAISILSGLYIYSKKKDPNNFLIPLTTSIADLGSMLIFSLLIVLLI